MMIILPVIYFLSRLINFSKFPIFTDEAIYTYWAQVALHDPANRFISLEDGKQPLFIWCAAVLQNFIQDPLIATRLVSTLAGFGSMIGIYFLAKTLLDKKTAIVSSVLYIVLPFTLLYDRLALFDSLLTMLVIYATLFVVKLAKNPRLDLALLSGFSLGLGMITKSSIAFFLYLMPLSLMFFNFKSKELPKRLGYWASYLVVTFVMAQVIYNALRLSPLFYMISRKNMEFIRPLDEVIKNPLMHFTSNINALTTWMIDYMSPALFLIFLFGLLLAYYKKNLSTIYLSILVFVPFTAEALFNQVLYPRFILFYFPFIIIITSATILWFLEIFKKFEIQLKVVLGLILIMPMITSYKLLTSPANAKIASSDAGQYLNDWPAGYGVFEVRDFLKNQPQDKDIYIGTEGTFGLLPFALNIYFYGNPKIHIIGFWPVDSNALPQKVLELSKTNKTYFIFNENQKEIANSNLKLIAKYQKGRGSSYLRLFEVTPK